MKSRKKTKSALPKSLVLQPRASIAQAAEVHASLIAWLTEGRPLVVDASQVEEVDTAVLQLLIASIRAAKARGLSFRWQGCSNALRRAAALIGVTSELELTGSEPSAAGAT